MRTYIIQLISTDRSFELVASACYTKGGLVCFAYEKDGVKRVKKFPLSNIHSIDSEY